MIFRSQNSAESSVSRAKKDLSQISDLTENDTYIPKYLKSESKKNALMNKMKKLSIKLKQ